MKKLNIGIDIDATMYDLDVVEKVSSLLGTNHKSSGILHWLYDKQDINGLSKEFTDLIFLHFDDPKFMGNLRLHGYVRDKVTEWKDGGHNLYVITARRASVHIATIEMLNRDFGVGFFQKSIFCRT